MLSLSISRQNLHLVARRVVAVILLNTVPVLEGAEGEAEGVQSFAGRGHPELQTELESLFSQDHEASFERMVDIAAEMGVTIPSPLKSSHC